MDVDQNLPRSGDRGGVVAILEFVRATVFQEEGCFHIVSFGGMFMLYRLASAAGRSVPVQMMRVRHMRMQMSYRRVMMRVAVLPGRHRIVQMIVMAVVMAVCMLMIHRLMLVLMAVRFEQMQDDPGQHQA